MKYFMDTEFYEHQPTTVKYKSGFFTPDTFPTPGANAIQLISIGIVANDGREFYAENADFDWDFSVPEDHWLQDNVRPHLWGRQHDIVDGARIARHRWKSGWGNADPRRLGGFWSPPKIAEKIREFVWKDPILGPTEFYGWYCDYDWVVFCGLFGRMIDLPEGFPMYMRDLKQTVDMIGNPNLDVVKVEGPEHHALTDARDVAAKYRALAPLFRDLVQP